jgi:prolyl oligopeptidase PreP (S9A serine peptidase family)
VFTHTCIAELVECLCHGVQVSPDHSRLAYAVDTVGGEKFTLHVLDLATGQELLTPTIEVSATAVQTSFTSCACQLYSVDPPSVLTLFEDGDDGTMVIPNAS